MRILYLFFVLFCSCDSYLDAKSDLTLSTLDSKEAAEALLDGIDRMNKGSVVLQNASDEYYIRDEVYNAISNPFNLESYIWFEGTQTDEDWNSLYRAIYTANLVIDNLERAGLKEGESDFLKYRANASFYRAHAYSHLLQIYTDVYDDHNAANMSGIVIREDSDFSKKSFVSSLKDSYVYVIDDLQSNQKYLDQIAALKTRPSIQSSLALLARIYLYKGDYQKAYDLTTELVSGDGSELLDYNELDTLENIPFEIFNREVIFYSSTVVANNVYQSTASVSRQFYESYDDRDLRKTLYFQMLPNGEIGFKGSYNGSLSNLFNGIAWDEVYLIRAESAARTGNEHEALDILNLLKKRRWKNECYEPYEIANIDDVLDAVLNERKLQLFFRGNRFSDVKRYNKEGRGIVLRRVVNGQEIILEPNDPGYIWSIPKRVKDLAGL
ncbi:RagB/SusD family nutrient uptake outer membrane protein [Sphingobacterium phlebotomi]|uniref:RagB/SusD family nutrient uptake outer membrane protein n=1 Tax=Sphingobacterium phlebotomi TaxID=2605433 RepID=A0A5D4H6C2_9SPHI|nr:RagB/SusD family nutrient uptake outer membrane protein [Sphingobacterium phlebotomi]TYR36167.1 RagB/SusD family nutrient uptake outer membrane protein [Sphingobacterium phlebotomi]